MPTKHDESEALPLPPIAQAWEALELANEAFLAVSPLRSKEAARCVLRLVKERAAAFGEAVGTLLKEMGE